jgi:hypothetical protein
MELRNVKLLFINQTPVPLKILRPQIGVVEILQVQTEVNNDCGGRDANSYDKGYREEDTCDICKTKVITNFLFQYN